MVGGWQTNSIRRSPLRTLSLLVAFSISLASAQAGTPGTNGAGKTRSWTAIDGAFNGPLNAAFFSVVDDMVTLSYTEHYNVTGRDIYGRTVRQTGKRTIPIKVPLAGLCASDRRWIEEKNPCETCLTERSKKGAAGTLARKPASIASQRSWIPTRRCLSTFAGTKPCGVSPSVPGWFSTCRRRRDTTPFRATSFRNSTRSRRVARNSTAFNFKITDVRTKSGKHANLVEDYR